MCNIVKGPLLHQQRPKYLQPIDKDGHYPWMEDDESNRLDSGSSSSLASKDAKDKAEKVAKDPKPAVGGAQRASKRKATDDSIPRDSPVQEGKKHKAAKGSRPKVNQPRGSRKRQLEKGIRPSTQASKEDPTRLVYSFFSCMASTLHCDDCWQWMRQFHLR